MCACQKSYTSIIITSITWAGPRCVQEAATFLGPQNRTQGRCEFQFQWLSLTPLFPTGPMLTILFYLIYLQFYYFLNYSVPDKIWVESQPEKEGRHCPSCSQSSPSQSAASGGGLVVPIKLREIDGNRNWTNAELYSYQASSPLLRCAVAANMVILSGTTQVFTYTARLPYF